MIQPLKDHVYTLYVRRMHFLYSKPMPGRKRERKREKINYPLWHISVYLLYTHVCVCECFLYVYGYTHAAALCMYMDLGPRYHHKVSKINYGNIFIHILNQFFCVLSRASIKLGITSCKVENEKWYTIHCGWKKKRVRILSYTRSYILFPLKIVPV